MKTPLLDLVAQYRALKPEIDEAIQSVMEAGHFILGPQVSALEKEIAEYLDVNHGVGVASGTDALVLALRALGIGQGDEVILPAYTFFATAEAVMLVGATPVLVDIQPDTYCLDVDQVANRITERTKAIIPVHLYGHPADMKPLVELARASGLKIIEDNAQAFGAEYLGRKTGGFGDVGCLSFFPSKTLGGCGDGGMVVTNDGEIAERIRMLRTHGWRKKYHPEMIGYNSRLDELQAAILRVKLRHVDEWNNQRRSLAHWYTEQLEGSSFTAPTEASNVKHVYHLYIVRISDRKRVAEQLKQEGIASAIYYPQPLHLLLPCRELGYEEGSFPVSEKACKETLAIPCYPEMSSEQCESVVGALSRSLVEEVRA